MQITMCSWGARLARFIPCSNKSFENWQRNARQVHANKNATDAQGRSVIHSRTAISLEYATLFGIRNIIKANVMTWDLGWVVNISDTIKKTKFEYYTVAKYFTIAGRQLDPKP